METIDIRTSEYAIGHSPQVLTTTGIGSCIAICLYHRGRKIGALAHIMLPSSRDWQMLTPDTPPARFADTAVEAMLSRLRDMGVPPQELEAKIAGGAHMFKSMAADAGGALGLKNTEAVREALKSHGIRVLKADTGGDVGRSISFDLENGIAEVVTKM